MYNTQQEEIENLLQKESRAKNYVLISFLFGVFFLATLKDIVSAGFESAAIVIRIALMIGFILLAIYFYMEADKVLDDEEKDKLDNHREFLAKNQQGETKKQSFIDKYFTEADLESFRKIIYLLWALIFVILMLFTVISFGGEPAPEPNDNTVTTTTTTTPTTTTPTTKTNP